MYDTTGSTRLPPALSNFHNRGNNHIDTASQALIYKSASRKFEIRGCLYSRYQRRLAISWAQSLYTVESYDEHGCSGLLYYSVIILV